MLELSSKLPNGGTIPDKARQLLYWLSIVVRNNRSFNILLGKNENNLPYQIIKVWSLGSKQYN